MHVWSLDGRQLLATLHARLTAGADAAATIEAIKSRLSNAHGIGHATVSWKRARRARTRRREAV